MSTTIEAPEQLASNEELVSLSAATKPHDPTVTQPPSRWRRIVRGHDGDPAWARPAILALLVLTAAIYLYNLTSSGWANEFYAAAVQAGTKSWKAFLFGSSDWSNAITVDKTPASLWIMELSGRVFGFSSWSMLAPQVLQGVASVGLLYTTLRRWYGAAAGLLAGAVLALTPVAALMFRFNNPDAFLIFLLILGAYAITRAIETGTTRWLIATGVALGFGFLAKELQALLVVPGFALAYLVAAPVSMRKRILQLLGGLAALVVSCGWWIALVELWPAASRPFIGGSTNNSIIEVALGYNGLSRLTGGDTGNGGGGGGANFSGATSWSRLFNNLFGGEISWLLPAALIALVVGLFVTARTKRTNKARAGLIVWGGWLLTTAAVFSFASGTIHTYYAVALAPAIGAVLGIVAARLWQQRTNTDYRLLLATMVGVTGAWSYLLLQRTPDWNPWLGPLVVGLSVVGIIGLLADAFVKRGTRWFGLAVAALVLTASLLGPAAYAVSTVANPHTGSIPTSGPSIANATGGGTPMPPGLGIGGTDVTTDNALVSLLQTNAAEYRWAVATVGSQSSARLQLASDVPVMSIGGFTGSDPSPTLAQFQEYVRNGDVHYFVAGGGMGGGRGNSEIADWVAANFTAQTVGSQTVYDLSIS